MPDTRSVANSRINDVQTEVKTLVSEMFSSQNFIQKMTEAVSQVITSRLDDRLKLLEEQNAVSVSKIKDLENIVAEQRLEIDNMQQLSKLNSLYFIGIPNDKKSDDPTQEVINLLSNKFSSSNISSESFSCYRLGKFMENKSRPVIVKFTSVNVRNGILRNKSTLKGSTIVVRENLTRLRLELLKKAKVKYGDRNVWTRNGNILVKDGGKIRRLDPKEWQ